jgi:hypothetical protein
MASPIAVVSLTLGTTDGPGIAVSGLLIVLRPQLPWRSPGLRRRRLGRPTSPHPARPTAGFKSGVRIRSAGRGEPTV